MKKTFSIIIGLSLVIILSGCKNSSDVSTQTPETNPATNTANGTDNSQTGQLVNPAATNCMQKGGSIDIRKNKNGEYGVCIFEDNRQCEEWALFRGQCPVGGMKITGYENDAQVYCAITGGQVEGVGTQTPMCKRFDGTYCNAQANLDGECPDPNDTSPNADNTETP
jgi:putative hemolysin